MLASIVINGKVKFFTAPSNDSQTFEGAVNVKGIPATSGNNMVWPTPKDRPTLFIGVKEHDMSAFWILYCFSTGELRFWEYLCGLADNKSRHCATDRNCGTGIGRNQQLGDVRARCELNSLHGSERNVVSALNTSHGCLKRVSDRIDVRRHGSIDVLQLHGNEMVDIASVRQRARKLDVDV